MTSGAAAGDSQLRPATGGPAAWLALLVIYAITSLMTSDHQYAAIRMFPHRRKKADQPPALPAAFIVVLMPAAATPTLPQTNLKDDIDTLTMVQPPAPPGIGITNVMVMRWRERRVWCHSRRPRRCRAGRRHRTSVQF